jgi:hypothetical protein
MRSDANLARRKQELARHDFESAVSGVLAKLDFGSNPTRSLTVPENSLGNCANKHGFVWYKNTLWNVDLWAAPSGSSMEFGYVRTHSKLLYRAVGYQLRPLINVMVRPDLTAADVAFRFAQWVSPFGLIGLPKVYNTLHPRAEVQLAVLLPVKPCVHCDGTGARDGTPIGICNECEGTAFISTAAYASAEYLWGRYVHSTLEELLSYLGVKERSDGRLT